MSKKEIKKIVLAYSGGLDTSIIIPWLKENYNNPEIIAVAADVGQGDELDGLEAKAIKTGASKLYIEDLVDEMVDSVIVPSMMMGAKYEDYLLGTAFARPIIGKRLVDIARKEGADAIAHGCTGKGNDQVRFELAIKRFAPEMTIIAPWREWDIKGRDEEIDYAEAHNVPLKISRETNYSKDKNLWHLSHEGLDLEDPANEPLYDKPGFLEMGVSPAMAPDMPAYVTLDFVKGVPVAIDGEKMKASDIIRKLNKLGGDNGIGLLDIVENRLVGMKDRGVYETPGGTILYRAHEVLEMITLDKDTKHMKSKLAVDFADHVITEITCHARGGREMAGDNCSIIDVGGQDTKVILVENGMVQDFLMNDKCSAGTGKFLEIMANRLGVTLQELFDMADTGTVLPISSLCTVFAESEVINYIGEGRKREDIAAGVVDSVAAKVAQLSQKKSLAGRIILTGGLSGSRYFTQILSGKIGRKVETTERGRYAGALGASLLAEEKSR